MFSNSMISYNVKNIKLKKNIHIYISLHSIVQCAGKLMPFWPKLNACFWWCPPPNKNHSNFPEIIHAFNFIKNKKKRNKLFLSKAQCLSQKSQDSGLRQWKSKQEIGLCIANHPVLQQGGTAVKTFQNYI